MNGKWEKIEIYELNLHLCVFFYIPLRVEIRCGKA